jgi:hypothetical protein
MADGSGCIASARVGSRQSLIKKPKPSGVSAFSFCRLDFSRNCREISRMSLPSEPVTLSAEQVAELKRMLADLRHDINNNVALMLSAVEMMRRRPETVEKMLDSMGRQPHRITEAVVQFSKALESALQGVKPGP